MFFHYILNNNHVNITLKKKLEKIRLWRMFSGSVQSLSPQLWVLWLVPLVTLCGSSFFTLTLWGD